eukprot:1772151-Pyramimonas_sp.AAC.1
MVVDLVSAMGNVVKATIWGEGTKWALRRDSPIKVLGAEIDRFEGGGRVVINGDACICDCPEIGQPPRKRRSMRWP